MNVKRMISSLVSIGVIFTFIGCSNSDPVSAIDNSKDVSAGTSIGNSYGQICGVGTFHPNDLYYIDPNSLNRNLAHTPNTDRISMGVNNDVYHIQRSNTTTNVVYKNDVPLPRQPNSRIQYYLDIAAAKNGDVFIIGKIVSSTYPYNVTQAVYYYDHVSNYWYGYGSGMTKAKRICVGPDNKPIVITTDNRIYRYNSGWQEINRTAGDAYDELIDLDYNDVGYLYIVSLNHLTWTANVFKYEPYFWGNIDEIFWSKPFSTFEDIYAICSNYGIGNGISDENEFYIASYKGLFEQCIYGEWKFLTGERFWDLSRSWKP